jgi:hypothetical protein
VATLVDSPAKAHEGIQSGGRDGEPRNPRREFVLPTQSVVVSHVPEPSLSVDGVLRHHAPHPGDPVVLGQPLVVAPALSPTEYDRDDRHGDHQPPHGDPHAGDTHPDPHTGEARGAEPGRPGVEGREIRGVFHS